MNIYNLEEGISNQIIDSGLSLAEHDELKKLVNKWLGMGLTLEEEERMNELNEREEGNE